MWLKIPAIIATGIICFIAGLGLGVVADANYGDLWKKPPPETSSEEGQGQEGMMGGMMGKGGMGGKGKGGMGGMGGMMGKGGMGGKGKGGMGGMGGMGGGMGQPRPKNDLAALVTKLDQLTQKPLTIELSEEQRTRLQKQLDGFDKKEELSEEEARHRLQAIMEIVKPHKDMLETAGFRWPGATGGGGGPPANAGNPFTSEQNSKHLKSLQEQVTKKKGG